MDVPESSIKDALMNELKDTLQKKLNKKVIRESENTHKECFLEYIDCAKKQYNFYSQLSR